MYYVVILFLVIKMAAPLLFVPQIFCSCSPYFVESLAFLVSAAHQSHPVIQIDRQMDRQIYLDIRTFKLREQVAITPKYCHMEPVSVRITDQHITMILIYKYLSRIYSNKTIAGKFMYIPNNDIKKLPLCRLLVVLYQPIKKSISHKRFEANE